MSIRPELARVHPPTGRRAPSRPLRLAALLLLLAAAPAAFAQDKPPPAPEADVDLTELSLEELLDVSVEVTSVGRKKQDSRETAAAIHVITSEDIRRSGLQSIPELLRLVPGVHVARVTGHAWAISARGFNGRFNANLLVLIDGRSVYTPLFSGVYWDVQDVMVEDVERIEVILGPGAAAWGANAVNGVINVITKSAADTQGTLVSVLAGEEERILALRYGGEMEDGHWRAFAKTSERQALVTPGNDSAGDESDLDHAGFRADWQPLAGDEITLQGDWYAGDEHLTADLPSLASPPFVTQVGNDEVAGGNLLLRWTRELGPDDELVIQTYYDRTVRDNFILQEDRDTLDVDVQRHVRVSDAHDLVYGGGLRLSRSISDSSPGVTFDPDDRTLSLGGVFLEDEVTLVPEHLRLTAGARLEYHTYSGTELQPNVRMTWTPDEEHTLWAAVSRAVRVPSQADHDSVVDVSVTPGFPPGFDSVFTLVGNSGVQQEQLIAWEAGWRARLAERFWVDLAAFYNDYDDGITTAVGAPVPLSPTQLMFPLIPVNNGDEIARGLELATTWEVDEDWQLRTSYSWLDVHAARMDDSDSIPSEVAEGTAPENMALLQSHHELVEHWDLDVNLFYVDELPANGVGSYWRGDVRVGYRPDEASEWTLGVQNLFHDGDIEWDGEFLGAESAPQTAAYVKYTRRF